MGVQDGSWRDGAGRQVGVQNCGSTRWVSTIDPGAAGWVSCGCPELMGVQFSDGAGSHACFVSPARAWIEWPIAYRWPGGLGDEGALLPRATLRASHSLGPGLPPVVRLQRTFPKPSIVGSDVCGYAVFKHARAACGVKWVSRIAPLVLLRRVAVRVRSHLVASQCAIQVRYWETRRRDLCLVVTGSRSS